MSLKTTVTNMAMVLMITWSCAVASDSDHDTSPDADAKRSLSSYYQPPQLSPDTAVRHFMPGSDHFQDWAAQFGRDHRSASLDGDQPSQLLPPDDDNVGSPAGSFGTDYLQNWNSFLWNSYKPRRPPRH